MIATVCFISIQRLCNNKTELLLVFVVPVLFFSIFAVIFSQGLGHKPKEVRVAVLNDDASELAKNIVEKFVGQEHICSVVGIGRTQQNWDAVRLSRFLMTRHDADVVLYIPPGFSGGLTSQGATEPIQVLNEGTNPFGSQVVEAQLTQAIAWEMQKRVPSFAAHTQLVTHGPLLPRQSPVQLASTGNTFPLQNPAMAANPTELIQFQRADVFANNKHQPKVAMYAAGIAVMFLLFSSSGAGASLLEEKEAGTLERLLASRLSLTDLLAGKWLYISGLGLVQITTMFIWGQLVFDVDLLGHLPGFLFMSVPTAMASASFALFLAAICRSRSQLNAVALVLVLAMSALGGSMIPRYIMSDSMQRIGGWTFNGWALDGYKKIFWYDLPVSAIRVEVIVLLLIALGLGFVARIMAQSWRTA